MPDALLGRKQLLGQSSRYLAMKTRPIFTKLLRHDLWLLYSCQSMLSLFHRYPVIRVPQINMHWITGWLTQWPTLICWWFCNSGANRHKICVRLTKRIKYQVSKLTMMFKLELKNFRSPHLEPPVQNGLLQKVNIFCPEMTICMHFMHPPKIVQIEWGHHVVFLCLRKMVDFLIRHYTYRMFPPAIDSIPTSLAVDLSESTQIKNWWVTTWHTLQSLVRILVSGGPP